MLWFKDENLLSQTLLTLYNTYDVTTTTAGMCCPLGECVITTDQLPDRSELIGVVFASLAKGH